MAVDVRAGYEMRLEVIKAWWRHQMKTISSSLVICAGNSPVHGEFPAQRPLTRSFRVFFNLRLNEHLNKQSGDLRLYCAYYDVVVMGYTLLSAPRESNGLVVWSISCFAVQWIFIWETNDKIRLLLIGLVSWSRQVESLIMDSAKCLALNILRMPVVINFKVHILKINNPYICSHPIQQIVCIWKFCERLLWSTLKYLKSTIFISVNICNNVHLLQVKIYWLFLCPRSYQVMLIGKDKLRVHIRDTTNCDMLFAIVL